MKQKLKAAWLWSLLPYISILFSLVFIGKTHLDKVQRDQARQQQKIELNAISLENDKLGRDINQYKRDYGALLAHKKPWTNEQKARAKVAEHSLESLRARLEDMKRRTREFRGLEK